MFVPKQVDLTIYQGSTFRKAFSVKTKDALGASIPFDLTGWTARMQIRERIASESQVVELTTENGGITLETVTTNGLVTDSLIHLYLSPTQTDGLVIKKGKYDVELRDAAGDVGRIIQGSVTINPQVTR